MMNTGEALRATRELIYGHPGTPAREFYKTEKARIHSEFEAYLADEYASHLPMETHSIIWSKAWELGHDSGLSEVELHYSETVGFLDSVFTATKK